jgi:hypothetical protein
MSMPMSPPRRELKVPLRRRTLALAAVGAARLIALQPPSRIQSVLAWVRRGAKRADYRQTLAAHEAVMAVSTVCRGPRGCLPRSLATALVCRASGAWPTWCVGVYAIAPFAAHAWVEADGTIVGEPVPADRLRPLLRVGPFLRAGPSEIGMS